MNCLRSSKRALRLLGTARRISPPCSCCPDYIRCWPFRQCSENSSVCSGRQRLGRFRPLLPISSGRSGTNARIPTRMRVCDTVPRREKRQRNPFHADKRPPDRGHRRSRHRAASQLKEPFAAHHCAAIVTANDAASLCLPSIVLVERYYWRRRMTLPIFRVPR
jgi:hypothetical protein